MSKPKDKPKKSAPKSARIGRPSLYSKQIADVICEVIANGGGLDEASAATGVGVSTICLWLTQAEKQPFMEQYAHARSIQADVNADRVVTVSSDQTRDPSCRKVEADARKWRAAKLEPKKYGDKIDHEHAGPNGGAIPIAGEITFTFVRPGDQS